MLETPILERTVAIMGLSVPMLTTVYDEAFADQIHRNTNYLMSLTALARRRNRDRRLNRFAAIRQAQRRQKRR